MQKKPSTVNRLFNAIVCCLLAFVAGEPRANCCCSLEQNSAQSKHNCCSPESKGTQKVLNHMDGTCDCSEEALVTLQKLPEHSAANKSQPPTKVISSLPEDSVLQIAFLANEQSTVNELQRNNDCLKPSKLYLLKCSWLN